MKGKQIMTHDRDISCAELKLLRARNDYAAAELKRIRSELDEVRQDLARRKYDQNQPRVPAGRTAGPDSARLR